MNPDLLKDSKPYLLIKTNKIIKVYFSWSYSYLGGYYSFTEDTPAMFFSKMINLQENQVKTRLYEASRLWTLLYEN
jgi:hypothetical protein